MPLNLQTQENCQNTIIKNETDLKISKVASFQIVRIIPKMRGGRLQIILLAVLPIPFNKEKKEETRARERIEIPEKYLSQKKSQWQFNNFYNIAPQEMRDSFYKNQIVFMDLDVLLNLITHNECFEGENQAYIQDS